MDQPRIDDAAIALDLAAHGRAEEAERWFRRALGDDATDGRAALGLAGLLLDRRDLAGAVAVLAPAVAADPDDPRLFAVHRRIGLALFQDWFWEDALPWLERAAALEPWDTPLSDLVARLRVPSHLRAEVALPSGEVLRRYAPRESAPYQFIIDIVGTCNLRCPTCPVGNSLPDGRARGFMSFETFRAIIAKIAAESPMPRPRIALFNWGEPLLHPDLPRFIALLHEQGMESCLSSNLNIHRGLEAAIRANPTELKISISGFTQETYGRTHARGDVALVKENMRTLRALMDRFGVTTRVWVGHHLYRSNAHQMEAMRAFCAELRFEYNPIQALYMPLERLVEVLDGRSNPLDQGIIDDLPTPPAERRARIGAVRGGGYDCELRFNQTVINHDGGVALCCSVYDRDNMLGVGFLDEDFTSLERRKYAHPFCGTCMERNLHHAPAELFPKGDAPVPGGSET